MSFIPDHEKLFLYYRYILSIENILAAKPKKHEINEPIDLSKKIEKKWDEYRKKLLNKSDTADLPRFYEKDMSPSLYLHKDACKFFEEMNFIECFSNLKNKGDSKLLKKPLAQSIKDFDDFTYGQEFTYAYCIIVNFARLDKSEATYFPMAALMLPSLDMQNKPIPFNRLAELAKFILGLEPLSKDFDIEPQPIDVVVNPKLLEFNLSPDELFDIKAENAKELQEKVAAVIKKIRENLIDGDKLIEGTFVGAVSQNYTRGLLTMYDSLHETGFNDLLIQYFSIHATKGFGGINNINVKDIITSKQIVDSFESHFGSFDSKFSLMNSQRKAMACYLQNERSIIPVNGAPGTGKTALLRAISGDYIVKSALDAFEHFRKTKSVTFATPILCSSTNNQALYNICEGLESGFKETLQLKRLQFENKEAILYERWIKATFEFKDKSKSSNDDIDESDVNEVPESVKNDNVIDFSKTLYAPVVKNSSDNYFVMRKTIMTTILANASEGYDYYLNQFALSFPDINIDGKTVVEQLLKCAEYFNECIKSNITQIKKRQLSQKDLQSLADCEINAIIKNKTIAPELLKKILSSTIRSDQKLLEAVNNIAVKDPLYLPNLQSQIDALTKDINAIIFDINENQVKILSLEMIIAKNNDQIDILNDMDPLTHSEFKSKESWFIQEMLRKEIKFIESERDEALRKEIIVAWFLEKLFYKFFNIGSLARSLNRINKRFDEDIFDLKNNYDRQSKLVKDQVLEAIYKLIVAEKAQINEESFKIQQKINDLINKNQSLSNRINSLEKEKKSNQAIHAEGTKILQFVHQSIDEMGIVLDVQSIIDLLLCNKTILEIQTYEEQKGQLDKSLRTDNFYYALHLLEALFFIHFFDEGKGDVGSYNCPACGKGTMNKNNHGNFICSSCNATCAKANYSYFEALPYQSDKWFAGLFKNKTAFCKSSKESYSLIFNIADSKQTYINVVRSNNDWNLLLPIFPVISMTCNSMGSVIAEKKGNKKIIEPSLFDFMLIDEAGTIPPSKMVILQAAKRAMFFGDVKQLKPVFAFDVNFEHKVLGRYWSEEKQINEIVDNFSCAADIFTFNSKNSPPKRTNDAMSIANASTIFFLPYNPSKLEGDIWLKEHFRCALPIASIANELTYFNEVIPMKKQESYKHLYFVERDGERNEDYVNTIEAEAIVKFIIDKKEIFKAMLNIQVDNEFYKGIGIVTPFSNQHYYIEKLLNETEKNYKGINLIKVGTVHKYQGSERRIIIFASVYGMRHAGKTPIMFFNRDETEMINVAVTRAKDIFVCFGNKEALKQEGTYSGLMLNHILMHNPDILKM
ncbi:AAA domain-containing protein [Sulfuricurvum sp.]|uniref:DEAD/DEAH box helicase n=1 Tax=Sulfuricurvum sp. TaxID=2025608 RepID=UPI003C4866B9